MNTTRYLSDESIMPNWSKAHGGKKMVNVPAKYLIWVYENNRCTPDVKDYVERNMDALQLDIKQQENSQKHWNTYNSK